MNYYYNRHTHEVVSTAVDYLLKALGCNQSKVLFPSVYNSVAEIMLFKSETSHNGYHIFKLTGVLTGIQLNSRQN